MRFFSWMYESQLRGMYPYTLACVIVAHGLLVHSAIGQSRRVRSDSSFGRHSVSAQRVDWDLNFTPRDAERSLLKVAHRRNLSELERLYASMNTLWRHINRSSRCAGRYRLGLHSIRSRLDRADTVAELHWVHRDARRLFVGLSGRCQREAGWAWRQVDTNLSRALVQVDRYVTRFGPSLAMHPRRFERKLRLLQSAGSSYTQMRKAEALFENEWLTNRQLAAVLQTIDYETHRLAVLEALAPQLVGRGHDTMVLAQFSSRYACHRAEMALRRAQNRSHRRYASL